MSGDDFDTDNKTYLSRASGDGTDYANYVKDNLK
jgi:hypothetical protein